MGGNRKRVCDKTEPSTLAPTTFNSRSESQRRPADQLVVVGLVRLVAAGKRQVVIVANNDVPDVQRIDVFDGGEGKNQHAIVQRFACRFAQVSNDHQVNVSDFAQRTAGIGIVQFDHVHALEFSEITKAIGALLVVRTSLVCRAFAVVTLNDQAGSAVNHVEANRHCYARSPGSGKAVL